MAHRIKSKKRMEEYKVEFKKKCLKKFYMDFTEEEMRSKDGIIVGEYSSKIIIYWFPTQIFVMSIREYIYEFRIFN